MIDKSILWAILLAVGIAALVITIRLFFNNDND